MRHSNDSSSNLTNTEQKHESVEVEDDPASVTHMGCGFGRCRPRFLQIFANPIVFMIILNIYCLVEGAIVSGECIHSSFPVNLHIRLILPVLTRLKRLLTP